MFELLNPLYFYIGGALGVVIPLVLHLIQRSRTVRFPFSTLRFLKLAQKKSSSRLKIEHFLLWIIRTLLLVLLSLAFAILMMRSKALGNWFGQAARDVAIVIDGSYSMDYNLGRKTVWQEAIENAVSVVEGLTERDRFCIFVAGDHVTPLIEQLSGNKEEAVGRLKALKFSQGSSQLAPALMDASAILADVKEKRQREVFVITDTQALPWRGFGSAKTPRKEGAAPAVTNREAAPNKADGDAAAKEPDEKKAVSLDAWDPTKIDPATVCFVSLLGANAPENATAIDVTLDPPILMKDVASRATVKLLLSGATRETVVTLFVDDKEVASQSVPLETNRVGEASFIVPPLSVGRHSARFKMPDDNLMLDNQFFFLIKAEDQFPTLCVGTREDTLFLRAALSAGMGVKGAAETDWVEPGGLSQKNLQAYSCVFLCNAVPLGADDITVLEKFVDAGGLMILFPGDRAAATDYQSFIGSLPGVPVSVDTVPLPERKQLLNWDAPNHAILAPLKIGETALTVAARKRLTWKGLEKGAERLISIGGEHPFLMGRPRGRGYVLLFAVAADRTWSDFPLSPFYLPIVRQIVLFGAGVGSRSHHVWCTPSLPLEPYLPEATRESVFTNPGGENVPVRSTLEEGQTVLRLDDLTTAGVYRMAAGAAAAPALAVNMRREESDLSPVNPADIEGMVGLKHVYVSRDKEELLTQIHDSRIGRTFAEEILWLVLILAAIEFFYANRLLKSSPKLSETLDIEASGRMHKDHKA
jgi:hypothetical protein